VERLQKTGRKKDNLKIFEKKIMERLEGYVYGRGNTLISDDLKAAIEAAGEPVTISAAESITGGLISSIITDTPGSSGFFKGSVVSYSESAKEKILGIDPGVIKSKGAVSSEVCIAMAKNVRSLFGTDYSLSVTGYAGPEYKGDNLGQVFCCIKGPSGYSRIFEKKFLGNRTEIKFRTTQFVLNELRNAIRYRRS
jgi:PncC family amidohydrolase